MRERGKTRVRGEGKDEGTIYEERDRQYKN